MRRNENSQHQRNQVVVVMHKPHEVGYVHAGRVNRYTPEGYYTDNESTICLHCPLC